MDIIEGHPIPQDITGFQFRIIGDLTIKQFGYLAVGLVLGWVFFSIPMPFIIKIPLAIVVAGTGIVFAFVPIQGRPADTMLMLFIKAVLNANEYTYQKQQGLPLTAPQQVAPVAAQPTPPAATQATNPTLHQPAPEATNTPSLAAPSNPPAESPADPDSHAQTLDLAKQLEDTRIEKQKLEEQLLSLQQQLQQKPQQIFSPTPIATQQTDHVKAVPGELKKSTGAPLAPDAPNLILGVVKDPRGNILPNILIEVKDKDGNPVRAFKTNPLGQFASATPLLNGTYVITFEDPKQQQQFDTITITADGDIIPPFEVTSVDERENLRKSLFGG